MTMSGDTAFTDCSTNPGLLSRKPVKLRIAITDIRRATGARRADEFLVVLDTVRFSLGRFAKILTFGSVTIRAGTSAGMNALKLIDAHYSRGNDLCEAWVRGFDVDFMFFGRGSGDEISMAALVHSGSGLIKTVEINSLNPASESSWRALYRRVSRDSDSTRTFSSSGLFDKATARA